jgi:hypothetical protein
VRTRITLAVVLGALLALVVGASPANAELLSSQRADSLTAGGQCKLIPPLRTATPIGAATPCDGVRPGALVESDIGLCTMNFLFTGSDGHRYIGTAGHCIIEAPSTGGDFADRRWGPGQGPVARDGDGNRIGEFAYAALNDSQEADFALIRLDAGVPASGQMCHFGGPTGLNSDRPGPVPPTVLNHFGNGILVGNLAVTNQTTVPARSAVALGMPNPRHVYAEGLVVPGDSGSGIQSSDGRAVGVIVTTGIHAASVGTSGVDAGTVGVVRLGPMVQRAESFTGVSYALQTAPTL